MTVDLQISDTISAKEKKEKKERKRKDKTAKKDVEDNVGTGGVYVRRAIGHCNVLIYQYSCREEQ